MRRAKTETPIRRDDVVPRIGPEVPILRILGSATRTYEILSPRIQGFWSHWDGQKTVACVGELPEQCVNCLKKFPLRWKGFLNVWDFARSADAFLELTPYAATSIGNQLGKGESLRGMRLNIRRTSDATRAHLRVELLPALGIDTGRPQWREAEPYVRELWGCVPRIDLRAKSK